MAVNKSDRYRSADSTVNDKSHPVPLGYGMNGRPIYAHWYIQSLISKWNQLKQQERRSNNNVR